MKEILIPVIAIVIGYLLGFTIPCVISWIAGLRGKRKYPKGSRWIFHTLDGDFEWKVIKVRGVKWEPRYVVWFKDEDGDSYRFIEGEPEFNRLSPVDLSPYDINSGL